MSSFSTENEEGTEKIICFFSQGPVVHFSQTFMQFRFHFHAHLPKASFKNLINQHLQEMNFKFALEQLVLMTRQEMEITSFYLPDHALLRLSIKAGYF